MKQKSTEEENKNNYQSKNRMNRAWSIFFRILRLLHRYNKTGKQMPNIESIILKLHEKGQIFSPVKRMSGQVERWTFTVSNDIKIETILRFKEARLKSSKVTIKRDDEINSFEFKRMPQKSI